MVDAAPVNIKGIWIMPLLNILSPSVSPEMVRQLDLMISEGPFLLNISVQMEWAAERWRDVAKIKEQPQGKTTLKILNLVHLQVSSGIKREEKGWKHSISMSLKKLSGIFPFSVQTLIVLLVSIQLIFLSLTTVISSCLTNTNFTLKLSTAWEKY